MIAILTYYFIYMIAGVLGFFMVFAILDYVLKQIKKLIT